jgi:transcriptional regulator NrdR family protein
MKCPKCGTWSIVLSTRSTQKNTCTRRRECANMHRFTTTELLKLDLKENYVPKSKTIPTKA